MCWWGTSFSTGGKDYVILLLRNCILHLSPIAQWCFEHLWRPNFSRLIRFLKINFIFEQDMLTSFRCNSALFKQLSTFFNCIIGLLKSTGSKPIQVRPVKAAWNTLLAFKRALPEHRKQNEHVWTMRMCGRHSSLKMSAMQAKLHRNLVSC